jgi:tRNA threonylcarbamoyladenosine modification (KEOPS) complex  Pcc1 subunit
MPAATKSISATIIINDTAYRKILAMKSASRYKRSIMKVRAGNDKLIIEINADDFTALRATINSVLRDLQVASSIIPLNKKKSKSI